MNILLVNYEYPPIGAGAATASKYLAEEMARAGHFVGVLTSSFGELKGETQDGAVHVYRCRSRRKKQFQSDVFEMLSFIVSASFRVGKLIKKWNIDHLIVFFAIPGGPVGLVGNLMYKTPYLVSLRGGDIPGAEPGLKAFHFFLKPLRRLILHKSESVVANSMSLMELAFKSDPMDYKIIPNGVDTDYYCPADQSARDQNTFQFLFVGRMQPQKNLFFLLDCIAGLKNKTSKLFIFNIAGDGYLRADLENYAVKLGIERQIIFHGWLDKQELLSLYQKSDCVVNPSLYEGMSNVLLEAMACGLPVIASNVTGNDVLVEHNTNGYLFNLGKQDELIDILKSVVENPAQLNDLGNNARAIVIEKYSWQEVAAGYISLLKKSKSDK
jgi:glycosyltransferase involved in cell wall biosynthesis